MFPEISASSPIQDLSSTWPHVAHYYSASHDDAHALLTKPCFPSIVKPQQQPPQHQRAFTTIVNRTATNENSSLRKTHMSTQSFRHQAPSPRTTSPSFFSTEPVVNASPTHTRQGIRLQCEVESEEEVEVAAMKKCRGKEEISEDLMTVLR